MTMKENIRIIKKPEAKYYVANWKEFKMPEEISESKLRNILSMAASFKRLEICPFGADQFHFCEKFNMDKVYAKIISDAIQVENTTERKDLKDEIKCTDSLRNGTCVTNTTQTLNKKEKKKLREKKKMKSNN
ncbi:hypothetical protein RR48_13231 [Papilio machaon]|uniref:Uncharacterized protein n=1 Tax=Papilio machaon TaxID=76193 RepID=A0A194QVU7_PAPMA|nr:hypothetical protein RR48_13231 [Papilio machaon]